MKASRESVARRVVLLPLTVVAGTQAVGVMLIGALLVTLAATVSLLSNSRA